MIESKGPGKCPLEIGCKLTIYGTSPQSQQLLMMVCQAISGLRPPTTTYVDFGCGPHRENHPGLVAKNQSTPMEWEKYCQISMNRRNTRGRDDSRRCKVFEF